MISTIPVFIVLFSILVIIHEFGHFISAKRSGIKVEEFAISFPPRLFSKKIGETVYSLNLIPLGGYVKVFGEDGENRTDPKSFSAKPVWTRFLVLVSGVLMNFILAAVLFSVGFAVGLPASYEENERDPQAHYRDIKVQITQVLPASPAEEAGLRLGDVVTAIEVPDGERVSIIETAEIRTLADLYRGERLTLFLRRGENEFSAAVTPRVSPPEGQGPIGIATEKTAFVSYPWYKAFPKGAAYTVRTTGVILSAFASTFKEIFVSGKVDGSAVTGPIGIVVITSFFTELGVLYLLQFAALFSINLAIINALPIPALDGGRILFVLIEKIKGSRVDARLERKIHSIGFAVLGILIVLITIKDIIHYF